MGCSINWPNFIVWLPLICEILSNMSVVILCQPGCDVINFEINLLSNQAGFFYLPKKSRQKFKYLENEKSFYNEIKSIFHQFWRAVIETNKKFFFGMRQFDFKTTAMIPFQSTQDFCMHNQTYLIIWNVLINIWWSFWSMNTLIQCPSLCCKWNTCKWYLWYTNIFFPFYLT